MADPTLIVNANIVSASCAYQHGGIFINKYGRIADVFSMDDFQKSKYGECTVLDAGGLLLVPGLLDTHIHGIGGYGTDDGEPSSILRMSESLARYGVTGFLPTLYAGRPEKMIRETKAVIKAMGNEKGARILGINLEGPFLSPEKCGAQDLDSLRSPDVELFKKLIDAGEGQIRAMTVAPELKGIDKITEIANDKNIVLLMGHTDATYGQAKTAMDLGVLDATHMFNAMSPLGHKDPGVSGAVLFDDRCRCEIIADGVHVNKDLVMHVIKTKPSDKVVLITDSLAPTSLGNGKYIANGDEVELGEAGAFFLASDHSKLCGSALTLNRAVANVCSWGAETRQAVTMATENPAKGYGFKELGNITKGNLASLVLFDNDFNTKAVLVEGRRIL